ncbi:multicopper oxidase domain-containing protein [Lapillicoccus jejuensis]|uniref:Multicopper oxidase n=1 Tax=Lapillicoccus jejuensis TaxID=402171 RepID=A0A542E2W9_9MICO|nr:multicopper oxidase domain-containing protein [Lapillicoccus jejuensis]TQJ09680.1 multicopper oxidase [Lapillicoccus jejuensis]
MSRLLRRLLPGSARLRPVTTRLGLGAAVLAMVAAVAATTPGSAQAATSEGLACDTSPTNSFTLTADDGYISTPDGNSIYTWSYADEAQRSFQFPGPVLCVDSGAPVTVVLHNHLPEATSIIFPGQRAVRADGRPAAPQFATDAQGDPTTTMTSMVQSADALSGATPGEVTYTFTAGSPGTYLYKSGTDADKQDQMGLYGALIVRPAGHAGQLTGRGDSAFDPAHEYLFLLSEVDPDLHLAVERHQAVDWAGYRARYFLINGRSMPDTLAPNNAPWLPNQPYGAMVHIKPYDPARPVENAIRYLNAGTHNYPFHPHGSDERVVTTDGQALQGAGGEDLSYSKYDLDVAPGQSLDVVFHWQDAEGWTIGANGQPTHQIPTQIPAITDQLLVGSDTWFSQSPYLGQKNAVPTYITDNNACGEYYHIAHSHALQEATNYGATFGGMMTLYRIDPPAGCPGN